MNKDLKDKLDSILHLNGCQQRTAGHNEALDGKELDMDDMERLEEITLKEVLALFQETMLECLPGKKPNRNTDDHESGCEIKILDDYDNMGAPCTCTVGGYNQAITDIEQAIKEIK